MTLDTNGVKTGAPSHCNKVVRGTKTTAIEYWGQDFWSVYDTLTNLSAAKGSICDTDFKTTSGKVPTDVGDGVCKNAVSSGTTIKPGWGVFAKKANEVLAGTDGNPIWGAAYCPQANDVCDT